MRTFDPVLAAALALGAGVPIHAQPASFVMAACGGETTRLAEVTLPQAVVADGTPLPAGRYEIRLTTQHPAAAPGAAPEAECWVQFLRDGVMAGREVATVIADRDAPAVVKGPAPKRNTARVDLLKGGDYVRIWVNRDGTHYLINLPPAS